MDLNYNDGLNTNTSGKLNLVPQSPDGSGTSLWIGNYPSMQQLHHLNAQMGTLNLTDTGTNYLDALLALSQGGVGTPQGLSQQGPFLVASVQPTVYNSPPVLPSLIPNSFGYPLTIGQDQGGATPPSSLPLQTSYTQTGLVSETPFSSQVPAYIANDQVYPSLIGSYGAISPTHYVSSQQTEQCTKDVAKSKPTVEIVSHPRQRAAMETVYVSTSPLKSPVRPENDVAKLLLSPKRSLDGRTVTSSTSIPGSPASIEYSIAFSDSGSSGTRSPMSPNSPRFSMVDREVSKSPMSPTETKSLINLRKFPQDQCFRCNKKVYTMEKIGPVKDVLYHKGCFQCRVCHTRLTLKNFFHNQHDMDDLHVYCKSHQPEAAGKGATFDSSAVQIKGAMSVPKLSKVNEQIRGDANTKKGGNMDVGSFEIKSALIGPKPDLIPSDQVKRSAHVYNIGLDSLEISHATNVPAVDLQTGNKLKRQSWKKEGRQHESVPPPDIVRYDEPVPDYDLVERDRIPVEFYPEYDYDEPTERYFLRRQDNL